MTSACATTTVVISAADPSDESLASLPSTLASAQHQHPSPLHSNFHSNVCNMEGRHGRLAQTRSYLSRNQSRQGSGFWPLKNGLSIDAYLLVRPEVPNEKTDYTAAQYFP